MNSDRLFGLAYVCERCHSGQFSRGYRLMCKLNVQWGLSKSLTPKEEWLIARIWAAHYLRLWRNKEITL